MLQESKEGFPGGKGFLICCVFFLGKELGESGETPDPLTYIFHIRQGVHDALNPESEASRLVNGRELIADDVVYTYQRTIGTIGRFVASTAISRTDRAACCTVHWSRMELHPDLVRTETRHIAVEVRGERTQGLTVVDRQGREPLGDSNVQVALEVNDPRFKSKLLESLLAWGQSGESS